MPLKTKRWTYAGWEVEAKTDGAGDTTLACPVGAKNHVEVRPRGELDPIIGNEVLELNANKGARDISMLTRKLRSRKSNSLLTRHHLLAMS